METSCFHFAQANLRAILNTSCISCLESNSSPSPICSTFQTPLTQKLLTSSKDSTITEGIITLQLNYCKRFHTDPFPSFFTSLCPIFHIAHGILSKNERGYFTLLSKILQMDSSSSQRKFEVLFIPYTSQIL